MTNTDLKKLRNKMPRDGVRKISDLTGFSVQYINFVLAGTKFNIDIIDSAISVAREYQRMLKKKVAEINDL